MDKILFITGPTASGKTELAIDLAKRINGDIISADSRQVYRGMDIGTGKDTGDSEFRVKDSSLVLKKDKYTFGYYDYGKGNKGRVRIWGLDIARPDQQFSVSHYLQYVRACLKIIREDGKFPIICGGTGMYIKSVISPPETTDIPVDNYLRRKIGNLTVSELTKILKGADETKFGRMNNSDRNNPRRLIRAIEVAYHKKKGREIFSRGFTKDKLVFGLLPGENHRKKISARVEKRIKSGIIDEIGNLLEKGYTFSLPSMNAIGYREWEVYFKDKEKDIGKIRKTWIENEVSYSKRQLLFMRKIEGIRWFKAGEKAKIEKTLDAWYTSEYPYA